MERANIDHHLMRGGAVRDEGRGHGIAGHDDHAVDIELDRGAVELERLLQRPEVLAVDLDAGAQPVPARRNKDPDREREAQSSGASHAR